MPNLRDKRSEQSQPTGGGIRRVMADGSETLAELQEFMGQMHGKSPQEVLGAVANSGLFRSTLVATIGFVVVLVGLSAASYYWKGTPEKENAKAVPAAKPDKKQDDTNQKPQAGSSKQAAATATSTETTEKSGDPTLDNLGIGDTKQTDPNRNPLEDSLDNLLDDAK